MEQISKTEVAAFAPFGKAISERFNRMGRNHLFEVDVDNLMDIYLASFPDGTNPIYRVRREFDCSCCRNFIKNLGKVVTIIDGQIQTVWDVEGLEYPFNIVAKTMGDVVRQLPIVAPYYTKQKSYGASHTYEGLRKWEHFHAYVPTTFVSDKAATIVGQFKTDKGVLERSLKTITYDALDQVISLIEDNNLYRGGEFLNLIKAFRELKVRWDESGQSDLFIWNELVTGSKSVNLFGSILIGETIADISNGVDFEKAVNAFEKRIAPDNYRRPKALVTPQMINTALATLSELGLEHAVERRYAHIEDINVNDVKFVDNNVRGKMKGGLKDLLLASAIIKTPSLDHAKPIYIDEFMTTVIPKAASVELLVENKHLGNFVSITAPVHENSGRLFKWNNDFAWSYAGDYTDSVKERVKRAGGNINVTLRVSLSWFNTDDLDIHAHCPTGHIHFGDKQGILDVDMNAPRTIMRRDAVENLAWTRPFDGEYRILVHNYTKRERVDVGFDIEIEFNGVIKSFSYKDDTPTGEFVECFRYIIQAGKMILFEFNPKLKEGNSPSEIWGITTQTLVPVDTILLSPNHWEGSGEVGNKHWFFILKDCKNPDETRGIYNEFLRSELEPHRRVFELLGAKSKCPKSDTQISGLGFSSTKRDTFKVVIDGGRAYEVSI